MTLRLLHIQKVAAVGGSERHLLALLPGLAQRGHQVRLCVISDGAAAPFVQAAADVEIETEIVVTRPGVDPAVTVRLLRAISREQPDIVHTHLIHADVFGQVAARAARIPGVSTLHSANEFYKQQPYLQAARLAASLVARTICVSRFAADFATSLRIARPERIRVIPHGIDLMPFDRDDDERDNEQVTVGILSRLVEGKGHRLAIHAFERAWRSDPRLRLVIAGEGPLRDEIAETAAASPARDDIRIIGAVSDVPAFVATCDVMLMPSSPELGEGFGLSLLEAMAGGRPVIATCAPPFTEVVVDEETGFLVPPHDADAIASALVRLAQQPSLRGELGSAGRTRAREEFSMERMINETIRVYEEIAS